MTDHPLQARLGAPGPKRILSLDGGGIRGLITLGYLEHIEKMLRKRHQRPGMVLADYFDLIAGTSTGSLIATLLSLGYSVEGIRELYRTLGAEAFQPKKNWLGGIGRMIGAKYDEVPLRKLLVRVLGDMQLDSEKLRTGLVVIMKRADTGSVWVVVNIPGNRYYEFNRGMRLVDLLRSSTAAPTFFRPEVISDVGQGERAIFVDGAISMHNNPALQALMVANLRGFGLEWPIGERQILLCSVGTGFFVPTANVDTLAKSGNLQWASLIVAQFIHDSAELVETVLQWMSNSPTAREIDGQIGDVNANQLAENALLSYLRYDVTLEDADLRALGIELDESQLMALKDMANVSVMDVLDRIGIAAAERQMSEEHFPDDFNLN